MGKDEQIKSWINVQGTAFPLPEWFSNLWTYMDYIRDEAAKAILWSSPVIWGKQVDWNIN